MKIRELYLKNFGKFADTRFDLPEHIHVFYGENEYGKSTLYAFIKAMLFGMDRGRGRAAGKDDFSRYEPWENPNYYAGVIRFTCGERTFRLERQFDRYAKQAVLICEDDGEELSVEDGDLTMLLGGMTLSSFENTAAIGRLTAKPGQDLAAELKNYAANYCETGGGEVDLQGALESLKARTKSVEQELRKRLDVKEREVESYQIQRRYVEDDSRKLQKEYQEKKEELKKYQEKQKDFERRAEQERNQENKEINHTEKEKNRSGSLQMLAGFVLAAAGAAGLLWRIFSGAAHAAGAGAGSDEILLLFCILLLAAGAVLTGTAWRVRAYSREYSNEETERKTAQRVQNQEETGNRNSQQGELHAAIRQLSWECQRIQAEWKEKQIQLNNLQEQMEEAGQKDDTIRQLEITKKALELASERIKSTAEAMTKEFGIRLNREASDILSKITNGKYTRLLIDDQLDMSVYSGGRKIPVERLSRGTLEQIYFSLRMAALDILYEEKVPVILDDAFAFYDEKRLKSVLKWLSEQPRQVIIFSCQRREEEILKDEDEFT